MNFGFWKQLERPVVALAPLANVTDAAFRRIIAKYGKPDVMWTEFVPADALCSDEGRGNIIHDLWKSEAEHPIVAQIYGGRPDSFRGAAKLCAELGFDGVDINTGCPTRSVEKHLAGAALIKQKNYSLTQEILAATKEGAGGLPVSIKTRIGYKQNQLETWLPCLMEAKPAVITLHLRTRDEMSSVPAKWDVMREAVELARQIEPDESKRPLLLGNGDVETPAEARRIAAETGCDGVMIGRGIFGNPWLFNEDVDRDELPTERILEVLLEHTELFVELFGDGKKTLETMKKHYKAYVSGWRGALDVRKKLMDAKDIDEIRNIIAGELAAAVY